MKEFLVIVATIALAFIIGGTLINGSGPASFKTTGTATGTAASAHVTSAAGW